MFSWNVLFGKVNSHITSQNHACKNKSSKKFVTISSLKTTVIQVKFKLILMYLSIINAFGVFFKLPVKYIPWEFFWKTFLWIKSGRLFQDWQRILSHHWTWYLLISHVWISKKRMSKCKFRVKMCMYMKLFTFFWRRQIFRGISETPATSKMNLFVITVNKCKPSKCCKGFAGIVEFISQPWP